MSWTGLTMGWADYGLYRPFAGLEMGWAEHAIIWSCAGLNMCCSGHWLGYLALCCAGLDWRCARLGCAGHFLVWPRDSLNTDWAV